MPNLAMKFNGYGRCGLGGPAQSARWSIAIKRPVMLNLYCFRAHRGPGVNLTDRPFKPFVAPRRADHRNALDDISMHPALPIDPDCGYRNDGYSARLNSAPSRELTCGCPRGSHDCVGMICTVDRKGHTEPIQEPSSPRRAWANTSIEVRILRNHDPPGGSAPDEGQSIGHTDVDVNASVEPDQFLS